MVRNDWFLTFLTTLKVLLPLFCVKLAVKHLTNSYCLEAYKFC